VIWKINHVIEPDQVVAGARRSVPVLDSADLIVECALPSIGRNIKLAADLS
jgi:hypothetical protein